MDWKEIYQQKVSGTSTSTNASSQNKNSSTGDWKSVYEQKIKEKNNSIVNTGYLNTQQAMAEADAIKQEYNRQRADGYRKRAQDTLNKIDELKTMNNTGNLEEDTKINNQITSAEKQFEFFASEYEKLTGQKMYSNFWQRLGGVIGGSSRQVAGQTANTLATIALSEGEAAASMLPQYNAGYVDRETGKATPAAAAPLDVESYAMPMQQWGDKVANKGAYQIDAAKYGLGKGGQIAVDVGSAAVPIVYDAVLNTMAPGLGTAFMANRSFGGGAMEARQEGQDIGSQVTYGAAQAIKEYTLNKLLGGVSKAYGKSKLGEVTDRVLNRLIKNETVASALGRIFNSEGVEEGLSTIVDPALKSVTYNGLSLKDAYSEFQFEDALYSALVGQILGVAGGGEQPEIDLNLSRATTAPQNAPAVQGDIQTSPITQGASTSQSSELNSQPVSKVTPKVSTKAVADAKMELKPVATQENTVAAQQQEGINNGTENTQVTTGTEGNNTAGRQNSDVGVQSERPRVDSSDGKSSEGGYQSNRSENVGEARQAEAPQRQQSSERVTRRNEKANNAIAKRAPGKEQDFAGEAFVSESELRYITEMADDLVKQGLSEEEINQRLYAEAVDSVIEEAIRDDVGRSEAVKMLEAVGFDNATANEVLNEILEGEELTEAEDDDLPFTMSEQKSEPTKPMEVKKPVDDRPKAEVSYSKNDEGETIATVNKAGADANLKGDTKAVKFPNRKYVKDPHDKVLAKNKKNGSYIIQHGVGDEYYIVNKEGYVTGRKYTNYGNAKSALFGKSDVYSAAVVPLVSEDGRVYIYDEKHGTGLKVDTDSIFTDEALHINQLRSAAAEDLGVEFSTYADSAVTADMFFMDFSGVKYANKHDKFSAITKMQRAIKRDGIIGENGKRYVFAGQTASQSRKNVITMIEKSKYDAMRNKMTGGLSAKEIAKFNPAKYLANRGSYFTPSNADTGVKVKDALVLPDIWHTIHAVTRRFMRTTDSGLDREKLIKAGYSESQADKMLNEYKVGQAMLITGDIMANVTDGTGFINSEKGESFQFRSLGGFKGLLQNFDFVKFFEETIPVDPDAEYVWRGDDGKEVYGGIRHKSKEVGVEMLDRWGKWQPIKDKKALLFESTVKWAGNYDNYDDFVAKSGDADIRSIPKENAYGSNPEAGMVEGHKRFSLSQFMRLIPSFSKSDFNKILDESVRDPIGAILNDPRLQAKLFGVDLDSKTPPASSDVKAMMVWYYGEDFLKTTLGKKWVSNKLGQIVDDARGGKLYFDKDNANMQWIAPDPFGVLQAMTSMRFQENEGKKTPVDSEGLSYNGYKGLEPGEISNRRLGAKDTLVARYPATEATDVQVRKNNINEHYAEFIEKYGASDDITYIALNDTLPFHLDSDYDGDMALTIQGALVDALKKVEEQLGSVKNGSVRKADLFTEFAHGKADKEAIENADVICAAVMAGLDAESIGKFDMYIDYIQSMPSKTLEGAARKRKMTVQQYRALLTSYFAVAYKFNIDYAKTGWYPAEYKSVVDTFMEEMKGIAKDNGYYIGVEGKDFFPVPEHWKYSNNENKKRKYEEAKRLQDKKLVEGKTILRGGDNVQTQLLRATGHLIPDKNVKDFLEFYFPGAKYAKGGKGVSLLDLSPIDPIKYTSYPSSFMESISDAYKRIMRTDSATGKGNAHRVEMLRELSDALGLNNEQFTSLMLYSLSAESNRHNWDTFLNFNQKNGEESTSEILVRNMRVLGNVATIEDALVETRESIDAAKSELEDARKSILSEAARQGTIEVGLIEELDSTISQLQSVYDEISVELDAANKTKGNYSKRVDNSKTLESFMKNTKGFEKYDAKVKLIESRLAAIKQEIDEATVVKTDSEENLSKLIDTINSTMSGSNSALEGFATRIEQLEEDYQSWLNSFERESVKKGFYSIGTQTYTGLEDADIAALTEKINGLFVAEIKPVTPVAVKPKRSEDVLIEASQRAPMKSKPVKTETAKTEQQKPPAPQRPAEKPSAKKPSPNQESPIVEPESPKAQPKELKDVYGDRYKNVSNAVDNIAKGICENGKVIIPDSASKMLGNDFETSRKTVHDFAQNFASAVVAGDGGESVRTIAKDIPHALDSTPILRSVFGDSKNGVVAKYAKAVAEAEKEVDFRNAVSDLAEVISKEIESFPQTLEAIEKWSNPKIKTKLEKKIAGGKKLGKAESYYLGIQRNGFGILKMLDGYDKEAGGLGYKLSELGTKANYNAQTVHGEVFGKFSPHQKAFAESGDDKKTVHVEYHKKDGAVSFDFTLREAVDLLHNFETLEESKLNAWKGVVYSTSQGPMRMIHAEQYRHVKKTLTDAIAKSETAKEYYDALSEGYSGFSDGIKGSTEAAIGRRVNLYEKGKYYPVVTYTGDGKAKGSRDYDFGLDSTGFTHRRTNVEGGVIAIMDPDDRFNRYAHQAMNLMAHAEIGAAMDRLDRGGAIPSISEIAEKRFGKPFAEEIVQFKNDANNVKEELSSTNEILEQVRLNIQGAVMLKNLGSVIRNLSSAFYAVGIMDFDSVAHGVMSLTNKEARTRASEVGAIRSRARGYIDPTVKEVLEKDSLFKKVLEKTKGLGLISKGFDVVDNYSMMAIYLAAEYQVQKEGINKGDTNYEEAVMSYFIPAFMQTQPQYDKLMRPVSQTSSNQVVRMLGMLRTQQFANLNLLLDRAGELDAVKQKHGEKSTKYKEEKASFDKIAGGLILANFIYASLNMLTDAMMHKRDKWREDEDEDEDGKRNVKFGKLLSDLILTWGESVAGTFLFGDEALGTAVDSATGITAKISGNSSIKTNRVYADNGIFGAISAIDDVKASLQNVVTNPTISNAKYAATDIANIFGISLGSAYSLANTVIMHGLDIAGKNPEQYDDVLKFIQNEIKKSKKGEKDAVDMLIEAGKGSSGNVKTDYGITSSELYDVNKQIAAYAKGKENKYDSDGNLDIVGYILKVDGLTTTGKDALINDNVSPNYYTSYNTLRSMGKTPEQAASTIRSIDGAGGEKVNGNITQNELKAAYASNPGLEYIYEKIWNAYGWEKSWDEAVH